MAREALVDQLTEDYQEIRHYAMLAYIYEGISGGKVRWRELREGASGAPWYALSRKEHRKLLHNDPGAVGLLAENPFPGKPPRYVRAVLYRYSFAPPGNPDGRWWNRERIGDGWLPALSADDPRLTEFLKRAGWR